MSTDQFIDVAMTSWPNHPDRLVYFRKIVDAHRDFLTASRHALRFYCSAESERDPAHPWCGDELHDLCAERDITLTWRDEPANLGANMNAAMMMCTGSTILLQQDDWLLRRPLDLSDGADFLLAPGHLSVVDSPIGDSPFLRPDLLRYSWPEDPAMLPTFIEQPRWPHGYRQIDTGGLWPYGDDPHLRRQDFFDRYGWYFEGGRHGTASGSLMRYLVKRQATIAADACVSFKHCGAVSAVIHDHRKRRISR